MPASHERSFYRRLSRVSGESVRTLRRLGFQPLPRAASIAEDERLAAVVDHADDVEDGEFDRAPLFVDWDALDDRFGVARGPLARAS